MIDNGSLRGNFVFTTPHFVFTPQLCVPQSCSHRNRLRNATDFATQPTSQRNRLQNAVVFKTQLCLKRSCVHNAVVFTTRSYSLRMYVYCVLSDLCSIRFVFYQICVHNHNVDVICVQNAEVSRLQKCSESRSVQNAEVFRMRKCSHRRSVMHRRSVHNAEVCATQKCS